MKIVDKIKKLAWYILNKLSLDMDIDYGTDGQQILSALASEPPELNLSENQILRLLPAQALVDYDQAENTLKTLWKMAWNDISAHYQARIALLEAEIEQVRKETANSIFKRLDDNLFYEGNDIEISFTRVGWENLVNGGWQALNPTAPEKEGE